jgi:hypothetical protein
MPHWRVWDAIGAPGVELRFHATTLYNSIYRFDDDMLVNAHVYGAPAAHSPVLHLRRLPGGQLFDHYQASFERSPRPEDTGTPMLTKLLPGPDASYRNRAVRDGVEA